MIQTISSNALLAAAFGQGSVSSIGRVVRAPSNAVEPAQTRDQGQSAESTVVDTVEISDAAMILQSGSESSPPRKNVKQQAERGASPQGLGVDSTNTGTKAKVAGGAGDKRRDGQPLTDEDKAKVQQLKQRDREVRTHEQAHLAAAGGNARGGPSFEFKTGPDGKQYAVSGEVNIDTSTVSGNPRATIAKMQQVRRAALAPAQPSSQDQSVAAKAQAAEQAARAELAKQQGAALSGNKPGESANAQRFSDSPSAASSQPTSDAPTRDPSTSAGSIAATDSRLADYSKRRSPTGLTVGLMLDVAG